MYCYVCRYILNFVQLKKYKFNLSKNRNMKLDYTSHLIVRQNI